MIHPSSARIPTTQPVQPWRQWLRPPLSALCLLACLAVAPCQAQTPPTTKLLIGVDEEPNTYAGVFARLVYAEISRRLAISIELAAFPEQRRSAMAEEGSIDGETSRVLAYGAAHPSLVRVEEPLIDLEFALYATNPSLRPQRLEDLSAGKLLGEHRRGVLFCEKALKSVLPAERVSEVTETAQGIQKLLTGRTDVYCDLEIGVLTPLHDPQIKGVAAVRKVLSLGTMPTYPYLNKKHAGLAPRMAAALKKMRAEGLIDAYQLQAQREMGWLR